FASQVGGAPLHILGMDLPDWPDSPEPPEDAGIGMPSRGMESFPIMPPDFFPSGMAALSPSIIMSLLPSFFIPAAGMGCPDGVACARAVPATGAAAASTIQFLGFIAISLSAGASRRKAGPQHSRSAGPETYGRP